MGSGLSTRTNVQEDHSSNKEHESIQSQALLQKGKKLWDSGTPLAWNSNELYLWLLWKKEAYPTLPPLCVKYHLNGEILCESSSEAILKYAENEEQRKDLLAARHVCRTHPMVVPFLDDNGDSENDGNWAEGERDTRCVKKQTKQKLNAEEAENHRVYDIQVETGLAMNNVDVIRMFHSETCISSSAVPATLKRQWMAQPKSCRRFLGAPLLFLPLCHTELSQNLSTRPVLELLSDIFRYSASMTAKASYGMSSYNHCSMRANPSSGGLHPEEMYCFVRIPIFLVETIQLVKLGHLLDGYCDDHAKGMSNEGIPGTVLCLCHYVVLEHALEIRRFFKQSQTRTYPTSLILFPICTLALRETWKYGVRGWRYTQLDVGHMMGSLLIALSSASRKGSGAKFIQHVASIHDSVSLGIESTLLGLKEYDKVPAAAKDYKFEVQGREVDEIIVAFGWNEGKRIAESAHEVSSLLKSLCECTAHSTLLGIANNVFNSALLNNVGIWAWAELVAKTSRDARERLYWEFEKHTDIVDGEATVEKKKDGHANPTRSEIPLPLSTLSTRAAFGSYADHVVRNAVLDRRSAQDFEPSPPLPLSSFLRIMAPCIPETDDFFIGLWINSVCDIPPGKYFLLSRQVEPDSETNSAVVLSSKFSCCHLKEGYTLRILSTSALPKDFPLYRLEKDASFREGMPSDESGKNELLLDTDRLRNQASAASCSQNLALHSSFTISMFTHVEVLCEDCTGKRMPAAEEGGAPRKEDKDNSCDSKGKGNIDPAVSISDLRRSADYQYKYWQCGFLGQHVYLLSQLQGAGCSGMGCYLDTSACQAFHVSTAVNPMYHMAVGNKVSDFKRGESFHYNDRLTQECSEIS